MKYVDFAGDTVTMVIQREQETQTETIGSISVTSTETDESFTGVTLEPGPNEKDTRTAEGTYAGTKAIFDYKVMFKSIRTQILSSEPISKSLQLIQFSPVALQRNQAINSFCNFNGPTI